MVERRENSRVHSRDGADKDSPRSHVNPPEPEAVPPPDVVRPTPRKDPDVQGGKQNAEHQEVVGFLGTSCPLRCDEEFGLVVVQLHTRHGKLRSHDHRYFLVGPLCAKAKTKLKLFSSRFVCSSRFLSPNTCAARCVLGNPTVGNSLVSMALSDNDELFFVGGSD